MLKIGKINFSFLIFILFGVLLTQIAYYVESKYHQQEQDNIVYATVEAKRFQAKSLAAVNAEYLRCMATNIYYEAGNEPFMGQVMVARVVMNRIKYGFAKNPCSVIYDHTTKFDTETNSSKKICQFNWTCEEKQFPINNASYRQAEYIARRVLAENAWSDIVPNNVLFFHNQTVNPNWNYEKVATIGNHTFYSKKRDK